MKTRTCVALVAAFMPMIIGCGRESSSTSPENRGLLLASKTAPPEGFDLLEPGFQAELMVSGLTTPQGADMRGNGVLFVVEGRVQRVVKVRPNGKFTVFAEIPAANLADLVIDPPRGMFISSVNDGRIFNLRFNGDLTEYATGLRSPTALALDSEHDLYAVDNAAGVVVTIDRSGAFTPVVGRVQNLGPRAITFDEQDRLYVLIRDFTPGLPPHKQAVIRRFDLESAASLPVPISDGELVAEGLLQPGVPDRVFHVEYWHQADGDLFVTDGTTIHRVRLDGGGSVSPFASGLQGGPFNALAVTATGDLIVSDYACPTCIPFPGTVNEGAGRVIRISMIR